jgi:ABC-type uncharacterized transport system auxiliary subunit
LSGAIVAGALAGCGGEGVPVPTDRFHRLTVGAPATVYQTPQLEGTVEVDRFNATGVLQDRAIIFIEHDNPNVMHQYHYQLWSDPPTRMLQMATVDYLRATHLADQVVKTGLRVVPAYTLIGDIKKLEHVVGNSSSVQVELEFGLRDHRDGSLVWVKSYTATKVVDDDSVAAATRAIGEAVKEILATLSADLARH